ncbi:MAG: hypothetical protein AB7N24_21975 [Dehalococcoidia bacterium]
MRTARRSVLLFCSFLLLSGPARGQSAPAPTDLEAELERWSEANRVAVSLEDLEDFTARLENAVIIGQGSDSPEDRRFFIREVRETTPLIIAKLGETDGRLSDVIEQGRKLVLRVLQEGNASDERARQCEQTARKKRGERLTLEKRHGALLTGYKADVEKGRPIGSDVLLQICEVYRDSQFLESTAIGEELKAQMHRRSGEQGQRLIAGFLATMNARVVDQVQVVRLQSTLTSVEIVAKSAANAEFMMSALDLRVSLPEIDADGLLDALSQAADNSGLRLEERASVVSQAMEEWIDSVVSRRSSPLEIEP